MKNTTIIIIAIVSLALFWALVGAAVARCTHMPPMLCGVIMFVVTLLVGWFGLAMCRMAARSG